MIIGLDGKQLTRPQKAHRNPVKRGAPARHSGSLPFTRKDIKRMLSNAERGIKQPIGTPILTEILLRNPR